MISEKNDVTPRMALDPASSSGALDRPLSPVKCWLLFFLSWLIPGSGFIVRRQYARGLVLFALIEIPFFIGVAMTGSVLQPAWSPGDWGANIVGLLTFVTQMGNGLAGGVWALGSFAKVPFFAGDPTHALFELASFYLMVSGGLNYFCVCNFYDRMVAPKPPKSASSQPQNEK
ncbi:MAG: hypothetical protein NTX50_14895 [Candidatus Sumerlaeota bacterium]|nr:hypothetical protein [Candidatus Sumerlaeota bacterium]